MVRAEQAVYAMTPTHRSISHQAMRDELALSIMLHPTLVILSDAKDLGLARRSFVALRMTEWQRFV